MRKAKWIDGLLLVGFLGCVLSGCSLFQSGPLARFEVTPLVLYTGDSGLFNAASSASSDPIVSYSWEFGDGGTAAGREVDHAYAVTGRYPVTLRVRDAGGRSAKVTQEVVVYVRTGTELFREDFSSGTTSISRWSLDPAWASTTEADVENVAGSHGFVLHIHSGVDRWHRRSAPTTLPPLRSGQRLVFSFAVMTGNTQEAETLSIFPARRTLDSTAGSLPYYVYTKAGGGATVRVPEGSGEDETHLIPFDPRVYAWHTYVFSFSTLDYVVLIDGVPYLSGRLPSPPGVGEGWSIVLGDESHAEACNAYVDDIRVSVEE